MRPTTLSARARSRRPVPRQLLPPARSVEAEPAVQLNLGCGADVRPGMVNVDRSAGPGVDRVLDLEQRPWPWIDGSVGSILARHVVEHLRDFPGFMQECHRVLDPGGRLEIHCPDYRSRDAWQDPTHVRAISPRTFGSFTGDRRFMQYSPRFEVVKPARRGFRHVRVASRWLPTPLPGGELRVVLRKPGGGAP
jgi:SAM-dependent methyltransferase